MLHISYIKYKVINHCRARNQIKNQAILGDFRKQSHWRKNTERFSEKTKEEEEEKKAPTQTYKLKCLHPSCVQRVHLDSDNISIDRIAFNSKRARFGSQFLLYIFFSPLL